MDDMVRLEDRAEERWVHLSGELDHQGCAQVAGAFREATLGGEQPRVVVNLSGVAFVASQGLRLLLQAHNALKGAGRTLHLDGMRPHIRRVLETTGILQAIPEWQGDRPF